MSTPITEKEQYSFPAFEPDQSSTLYSNITRTSEEDGTLQDIGEDSAYNGRPRLQTDYTQEFLQVPGASPLSPSQHREQTQRLEDDLEMLRAERIVSNSEATQSEEMHKTRSMGRSRSRTNAVPEDDFDIGTVPIHEELKIYQPPAAPTTKFASVLKKIHQSSFLVRYFCYIVPLVLLLLMPLLLGAFVFPNATVGDVRLVWFSIWLEIVWLTLWAGRILARCLPYPMGLISSLFTNDDKKWRDLGKELEVPATLFFWGLALEISFLPTMTSHHSNGDTTARYWEVICNKIIIALFAGVTLNFLEKILIQLIAISFHLRTYADRIDINRFQIGSLVKLYTYSKEKIAMEDSEFEIGQTGPSSGARTPMQYINKAGKNARGAINAVGDVVGKVAGDFTGRAVKKSSHPSQVILQLLGSTSGSQVLARRLYRTFAPEGSEVVLADDLRVAFDNNDEADAAFTMFDKDLNGDISMEELEAVCVEIGRERKAITASLKDLDSVVSKLNNVFVFIVIVITVLIFVSIISTSASGVLTSLGSSVLALSWLFSVTAQEFLQSCIFVFVKHPFDVGDRVTIYGNTGSQGKGDDYFVKEISLLFTEFKKMEGHVVQAPNSYLNTLFILNQRRSGGLAEGVPITVKFGTTLEQLDTLRSRLLDFVTSENREYQQNILTELTTVFEAYSISLNVVFFYKSNWQNELLRLQRRNKFICALMVAMQELGIEGPRQKLAGQSPEQPMYLNGAYPQMPTSTQPLDSSGNPTASFSNVSAPTTSQGPRSGSFARGDELHHPVPLGAHPSILRNPSISSSTNRPRGESISQLAKRVDFSLGMSSISSGAQMGDIYSGPARQRLPSLIRKEASPVRRSSVAQDEERTSSNLGRTTSRESSKIGSALGRTTSAEGSSTGPSGRTHRNRFFGRSLNRLGTAEEGTDMDDLEAGRGGFSVEDLPDIPESSGVNSPTCPHGDVEAEKAEQERPGQVRIDPRSGIVSPQAVARDSVLERGEILRLAPSQGSSDALDRLV